MTLINGEGCSTHRWIASWYGWPLWLVRSSLAISDQAITIENHIRRKSCALSIGGRWCNQDRFNCRELNSLEINDPRSRFLESTPIQLLPANWTQSNTTLLWKKRKQHGCPDRTLDINRKQFSQILITQRCQKCLLVFLNVNSRCTTKIPILAMHQEMINIS